MELNQANLLNTILSNENYKYLEEYLKEQEDLAVSNAISKDGEDRLIAIGQLKQIRKFLELKEYVKREMIHGLK